MWLEVRLLADRDLQALARTFHVSSSICILTWPHDPVVCAMVNPGPSEASTSNEDRKQHGVSNIDSI